MLPILNMISSQKQIKMLIINAFIPMRYKCDSYVKLPEKVILKM